MTHTKKDDNSIKSVWCTLCATNIIATRAAVISHITNNHPIKMSDSLIEKILNNTTKPKLKKHKKGKIKPYPTRDTPDPQVEHEKRWRNIISAGSPGLGKKR